MIGAALGLLAVAALVWKPAWAQRLHDKIAGWRPGRGGQ